MQAVRRFAGGRHQPVRIVRVALAVLVAVVVAGCAPATPPSGRIHIGAFSWDGPVRMLQTFTPYEESVQPSYGYLFVEATNADGTVASMVLHCEGSPSEVFTAYDQGTGTFATGGHPDCNVTLTEDNQTYYRGTGTLTITDFAAGPWSATVGHRTRTVTTLHATMTLWTSVGLVGGTVSIG
ncbi:MAG: hypothetical protein R2698_14455 [Microthrixaceae bacterium]